MQQPRPTSCSASSCVSPVEGRILQIYPLLRSIEYVRTTAGLTAKIVLALAVGAQRKARRLDIGKMRRGE